MKWFRNGRQAPRSAPPRPSARPSLEALEDRNLLNASIAFDAAGNMAEVVVFRDGTAFMYSSTGSGLIGQNVRVAHVFRDAAGKIGLDIVYNNGAAFEFTSAGSKQIGNNNVLDLSTAFDAKGNFRTLVLFADTATTTPPFGPDLTGNLFEFTNTSSRLFGTNYRWATSYLDTQGSLGFAAGFIESGGNLVDQRFDSTTGPGGVLLFNAPDGATQDLTDYMQASNAQNQLFTITTYGRFAGTYSLMTGPTGTTIIGNGTSILVGG